MNRCKFCLACSEKIEGRLVGVLLAVFGIGFAATSAPMDLSSDVATVSTAHVLAICLGVAGWMLGLARMAHVQYVNGTVRRAANVAATLLFVPILGQLAGLWSMPVTHRLVFVVVFGWYLFTSINLIRDASPRHA